MSRLVTSEQSSHHVCNICGSPDLGDLPEYSHAHLLKCKKCGMVFSGLIPDAQTLEVHYSRYQRDRYVSPLTIKRYEEILLKAEPYKQLGTVLDVGCGSGFFLETAVSFGWNATGTEYGQSSIDFLSSKGLHVVEGDIVSAQLPSSAFDFITSFEVIEHLSHPLPHAEKLFELLRPGGLLYITTPNFDSLTRKILKSEWNLIIWPEHLSYFDKKSLDRLLLSVGFKRVSIRSDGISVDRIRNSLSKRRVISENVDPATNKRTPWLSNEAIRQASQQNHLVRYGRAFIDGLLNMTSSGEFLKGYYMKPL